MKTMKIGVTSENGKITLYLPAGMCGKQLSSWLLENNELLKRFRKTQNIKTVMDWDSETKVA